MTNAGDGSLAAKSKDPYCYFRMVRVKALDTRLTAARLSPRTLISGLLAALVSLADASSLPAAPLNGCAVGQVPAVVEHRTFDPAQPPPELLPVLGREAALCEAVFEVKCTLRTVTPHSSAGPAAATVTNVDIVTRLRVVIWTPLGGPREYLEHEEAHRTIAEHYYQPAAAIAQRLGAPLVGSKLSLPAGYSKGEVNDAIRRARTIFFQAYMRETHERCNFAQDRFDTITDHGRNSADNAPAVAQAIADEEQHWRSAGS